MTTWTTSSIQANGLEVQYHRTGAGSGKPPLLLLHGYTDNAMCWAPVARKLEDHYDIIMTDARGHGSTRGPINDMAVDLLADDAAAVIQALDIAPAFVWGHSMGGVQTLSLAARYPSLVRAVILEDPPFMPEYPVILPPDMKQQLEEEARKAGVFKHKSYEERFAQGKLENPGWSDEELVPWAQSKGEFNLDIVPHRENFRTYNWQAAIEQVTCPLLLVMGGPQWVFITQEIAEDATRRCKTCEIAHIQNTGHSIHRDDVEGTLAAVRAFLVRAS